MRLLDHIQCLKVRMDQQLNAKRLHVKYEGLGGQAGRQAWNYKGLFQSFGKMALNASERACQPPLARADCEPGPASRGAL